MQQNFFQFFSLWKGKIVGSAILILLSWNFLVWGSVFTNLKKPDIEIYFFNVGQGDAHFIESRDGAQILLDGGPPNRILPILSEVLDFNDRHIDVVVLSHPHADHISGLIEVLKNYDVDYIFESGVNYDTPEAEEFHKLVDEKLLAHRSLGEGGGGLKKIVVDGPLSLNFFEGAMLRLIYPDKSFEGKSLKQVHDSMVVAELSYKNKKILFAGDMEKKLEEYLIKKGEISDIDVLKVGHQGSKTSSSQKFLNFAKPENSVIPVGKNSYGHPNQDIISRLASIGSQVFRTDQDGTIKLEIDSLGNLRFSSY
ncbi:MAG: MBL fold metallo-hydrolase [Patescibacteria group bacterium]